MRNGGSLHVCWVYPHSTQQPTAWAPQTSRSESLELGGTLIAVAQPSQERKQGEVLASLGHYTTLLGQRRAWMGRKYEQELKAGR